MYQLKHVLLICCLTFVLPTYAQKILNGSFEENSMGYLLGGTVWNGEFNNINVIGPYGSRLSGFTAYKSMAPFWFSIQPSIFWATPPDGNTYISTNSYNNLDTLVLKFSSPLSTNTSYIIRFFCGPKFNNFKGLVKDSVRICLGTQSTQSNKLLFSCVPDSNIQYQQFAVAFKPTQAYTNLFIGQDSVPRVDTDRMYTIVFDHFQLDTCVSAVFKNTVGCAAFPQQIQTNSAGNKYLWSTSDTTQQITAHKNGWYIAFVYDSLGCVTVDSIEVSSSATSNFQNDTICAETTIQLSTNHIGSFLWNTGDTSQSITATDSGLYVLTTTASGGCRIIDSFYIHWQSPPDIPLVSDTQICSGLSVLLNAYNPLFLSYQWSNGATDSTITVNQPGWYKVVASSALCSVTDSVRVDTVSIDTIVTDTSFCQSSSLLLHASGASSYLWNTNDTTSSITVTNAGTYWVHKTKGVCSATDTFYVSQITQPQSSITDTSFCETGSIVLTANDLAHHYTWNTYEHTQQIEVVEQGLYWVSKTIAQCIGTDSFNIIQNPLPIITSLKDTTVCFDEVAQLLLDAGQFKSYLWKPTGETTRTIYSTQAQVYLLSVTDSNNCSTTKQVAVMETCPDFVFVPNAFTPNGDGLNDVFLPHTRNLESYTMSIVNRWGEIVFTTTNPQQGWNGEGAHDGVYIAIINYTVTGKPAQQLKQTITLLR